jgi:hypothetical protein
MHPTLTHRPGYYETGEILRVGAPHFCITLHEHRLQNFHEFVLLCARELRHNMASRRRSSAR